MGKRKRSQCAQVKCTNFTCAGQNFCRSHLSSASTSSHAASHSHEATALHMTGSGIPESTSGQAQQRQGSNISHANSQSGEEQIQEHVQLESTPVSHLLKV